MAIFDKASPVSNNTQGATIIAECTRIKGEVDTDCSIHIDGKIIGKINSTNVVTIGKSGYVEGEIKAKDLIVSGLFEGTANCDVIEILPSGKIKGKIVTNELVTEKQGFFEGESVKKSDSGEDEQSALIKKYKDGNEEE